MILYSGGICYKHFLVDFNLINQDVEAVALRLNHFGKKILKFDIDFQMDYSCTSEILNYG